MVTPAPEPPTPPLSAPQREVLLGVAVGAVVERVRHGGRLAVEPREYPEPLRARRAVFVTLRLMETGEAGVLRGCIGSLEPLATLVEDTATHAVAAATRDPRFPPMSAGELDRLRVHLSVLTPPVPLPFADEADLLEKLRPGVDGLILEGLRGRRGTFLPAVWESLPRAEAFLAHLKVKAGLNPKQPLSGDLAGGPHRVQRYEAESMG